MVKNQDSKMQSTKSPQTFMEVPKLGERKNILKKFKIQQCLKKERHFPIRTQQIIPADILEEIERQQRDNERRGRDIYRKRCLEEAKAKKLEKKMKKASRRKARKVKFTNGDSGLDGSMSDLNFSGSSISDNEKVIKDPPQTHRQKKSSENVHSFEKQKSMEKKIDKQFKDIFQTDPSSWQKSITTENTKNNINWIALADPEDKVTDCSEAHQESLPCCSLNPRKMDDLADKYQSVGNFCTDAEKVNDIKRKFSPEQTFLNAEVGERQVNHPKVVTNLAGAKTEHLMLAKVDDSTCGGLTSIWDLVETSAPQNSHVENGVPKIVENGVPKMLQSTWLEVERPQLGADTKSGVIKAAVSVTKDASFPGELLKRPDCNSSHHHHINLLNNPVSADCKEAKEMYKNGPKIVNHTSPIHNRHSVNEANTDKHFLDMKFDRTLGEHSQRSLSLDFQEPNSVSIRAETTVGKYNIFSCGIKKHINIAPLKTSTINKLKNPSSSLACPMTDWPVFQQLLKSYLPQVEAKHSLATCLPPVEAKHSLTTCLPQVEAKHSLTTCLPQVEAKHSLATCLPQVEAKHLLETCLPQVEAKHSLTTYLPPVEAMHLLATYLPPDEAMHSLATYLPPVEAMHSLATYLPPVEAMHSLATYLPPVEAKHSLATYLPPVEAMHSLATYLPPVEAMHSLATYLPPVEAKHSLATCLPPVEAKHSLATCLPQVEAKHSLTTYLPPVEAMHLLATYLPPVEAMHSLATYLPPVEAKHSLATYLPPVEAKHSLATYLPPVEAKHSLATYLPPVEAKHSLMTCLPPVEAMHSLMTCLPPVEAKHSLATYLPPVEAKHSLATYLPPVEAMHSLATYLPPVEAMHSLATYLPPVEAMHSLATYLPPVEAKHSLATYLPPVEAKHSLATYLPPVEAKHSLATYLPPVEAMHSLATYLPPVEAMHSLATFLPPVEAKHSLATYLPPVDAKHSLATYLPPVEAKNSLATYLPPVEAMHSLATYLPPVEAKHSLATYLPPVEAMHSLTTCLPPFEAKNSLSYLPPVEAKHSLMTCLPPVEAKNSLSYLPPVEAKNSLTTCLSPVEAKNSLSYLPPVEAKNSLTTYLPPVEAKNSLTTYLPPVEAKNSLTTYLPPVEAMHSLTTCLPPVEAKNSLSYLPPVEAKNSLMTCLPPVEARNSLMTYLPPVEAKHSLATYLPPVEAKNSLSYLPPVEARNLLTTCLAPTKVNSDCGEPVASNNVATLCSVQKDIKISALTTSTPKLNPPPGLNCSMTDLSPYHSLLNSPLPVEAKSSFTTSFKAAEISSNCGEPAASNNLNTIPHLNVEERTKQHQLIQLFILIGDLQTKIIALAPTVKHVDPLYSSLADTCNFTENTRTPTKELSFEQIEEILDKILSKSAQCLNRKKENTYYNLTTQNAFQTEDCKRNKEFQKNKSNIKQSNILQRLPVFHSAEPKKSCIRKDHKNACNDKQDNNIELKDVSNGRCLSSKQFSSLKNFASEPIEENRSEGITTDLKQSLSHTKSSGEELSTHTINNGRFSRRAVAADQGTAALAHTKSSGEEFSTHTINNGRFSRRANAADQGTAALAHSVRKPVRELSDLLKSDTAYSTPSTNNFLSSRGRNGLSNPTWVPSKLPFTSQELEHELLSKKGHEEVVDALSSLNTTDVLQHASQACSSRSQRPTKRASKPYAYAISVFSELRNIKSSHFDFRLPPRSQRPALSVSKRMPKITDHFE